jgi:uncharacterized membrane protein YoaK (UPF0700 family)
MTEPVPQAGKADVGYQTFLLSFIAAFVDTCGFVGLFGLFTAHVTGNFVLIGAQLVAQEGNILAKLLSLPVFIVAVACAVLLSRALKRRGHNALQALLILEGGLLLLTVMAALAMHRPVDGGDVATLVIGMTAICAMGLQNALMRLELSTLPPTTVMTGNVTQVVIDTVNLTHHDGTAESKAAARARLSHMGPSIGAFFLGAAGGAFGYYVAGFVSLALPALLCLVLAVRTRSASSGKPVTQ